MYLLKHSIFLYFKEAKNYPIDKKYSNFVAQNPLITVIYRLNVLIPKMQKVTLWFTKVLLILHFGYL